jgi:chromosome segregation ATPase
MIGWKGFMQQPTPENTTDEAEWEFLLQLRSSRTPGRIQASGKTLMFGGYRVRTFETEIDAQYLAEAANNVLKLIYLLMRAKTAIQKHLNKIAELRTTLAQVKQDLADERSQRQLLQDEVRQLRKQLSQKGMRPKTRAKHNTANKPQPRTEDADTQAPRIWQGANGQVYQLIFTGDELSLTEFSSTSFNNNSQQ